MDDYVARMGFREALELYLFLEERGRGLEGGPEKLLSSLRAYLYDRLSIEEMESPKALLEKLYPEAL